ncbi:MAG: PEGA domain-containing protein, partial [Armatimonadetes bacterium]|nr:PEGA domain-containing protein [Armatimonadota bacterium]
MRRLGWLLAVVMGLGTAQGAETYVLAVAVDKYRYGTVSELKFAERDAEAFANAFVDRGVPLDHVTLLMTRNPNVLDRPDSTNIIDRLERFQRVDMTADDTFVFFFSGHGIQVGDESYLLTEETRMNDVARTALAMADVRKRLEGIKAGNVLLLIDACRNDPKSGGRGDIDNAMSDEFGKAIRPKIDTARNVATFTACAVGQRAYEMPEMQHGAFTYFLLNSINTPNSISVAQLADSVTKQVSTWAERTFGGVKQTPELTVSKGVAAFALVPPKVESILQVRSDPATAKIYYRLDGEAQGQLMTPGPDGRLTVTLKPYTHLYLTAVAPGYVEEKLELVTERGPQWCRIAMRPQKDAAKLPTDAVVRTTPPGGMVMIDGVDSGSSPLFCRLPVGTYRVTLVPPDSERPYAKKTVELKTVETGATELREPFDFIKGRVRISSDKPAAIFIDGENIRRITPAELDVPAGNCTIELRLDGHLDDRVEVRVKPNDLVEVPQRKMTPLFFKAVIKSEPAGAEVFYKESNGRLTPAGIETPDSLFIEYPLERTLVFKRAGYDDAELKVKGEANQTVEAPKVLLNPKPGTIFVASMPFGAAILVDGKDTGLKTPANVPAPAGEREITLRLEDHEDCIFKATVPAGQFAPADPQVLKPCISCLTVGCKLGAATVIINGAEPVVQGTAVNVKPGKHEVVLKAPGYVERRLTIELKPGERKTLLEDALAPAKVAVTINSTPVGATVILNGTKLERPTPVTELVNPGELTLKLEAPDHKPLEDKLQVAVGTAVEKVWALEKLPPPPPPKPEPPKEDPVPAGFRVPDYLTGWKALPNAKYRIAEKDGMPQVYVARTSYTMGSTDLERHDFWEVLGKGERVWVNGDAFRGETPARQVTVTGFWMDMHEVTNAQYCLFLNDMRVDEGERQSWIHIAGEWDNPFASPQIERIGSRYKPRNGFEHHPVILVS